MTGVRPARPWAPIGVSAFVLFVWWVVAHNSGSGWVQVLGDAAFGTIIVGIFGPAIALWKVRSQLIAAPTDATAGLPVTVRVAATSRCRVRPLWPPGPATFVGPTGKRHKFGEDVTLLPQRRGLHESLLLELASAAPFGLQWWSRKVVVPLPSALHVSPRPGKPAPLPSSEVGDNGDRESSIASESGDARGIRPYRPGDQKRRVHWASSAHAGRLMVRETEYPASRQLTLTVSLPFDEELAERSSERALGTAMAALDHGTPLVMATDEAAGPAVAPVVDRLEAGRRLARAIPRAGSDEIRVSW